MEVHQEKGHFLTASQKEVKQKIMEKLMSIIPLTIIESSVDFSGQALMDLNVSIIIMFTRDMIINIIQHSDTPPQAVSSLLDRLLGTIVHQIYIKLGMPDDITH